MKLPRQLLTLAVLAGLISCSGAAPERTVPEGQRFLVIGVDGLEWDVLLPLLHQGRMPTLQGLMARGHHGKLETFAPARSPAIWTSIATGKTMENHGIDHFVARDPTQPEGVRLRTSVDRKTSALWNIFSDFNRRVLSVGWWVTYPVEPVRGMMVAQTNTVSQVDTAFGRDVWKGSLVEGQQGQVYPPEREAEILALARGVHASFDDRVAERFGAFPHRHSELGRRLWENTLWSLRADMIYEEIAANVLASDGPFDLALVYFGAPDVVGHRFWRYAFPDGYLDRPSDGDIENYGAILSTTYAHADEQVGRLIAAAGDGVNVIVISDHGMHATGRDKTFPADEPPRNVNSGAHQDGPPGVLIAAGPAFKAAAETTLPQTADAIPSVGSVFDITPTLLALAGIPVGDDMEGRVIETLIHPEKREGLMARRIQTHDVPGWRKTRAIDGLDADAENERLEQLRALGYIN